MRLVDFSTYRYVPSILVDPIGVMAYEKLRARTKAGILPLFEMCWHPGARDFSRSLELLEALRLRAPFLLDLDRRPPPEPYVSRDPKDPIADKRRYEMEKAAKDAFETERRRLYQPGAGFHNWRSLASAFPHAVPVIQLTNPRAQRAEVLRQARLLCAGGDSVALRVTGAFVDEVCALAADILSRVDDPRQVLLVIDCGQGRAEVPKRSGFVADVLEMICERVQPSVAKRLQAVCMSNSFTVPNGKGLCYHPNYDWDVWQRVSTDVFLAFGDYAGSERRAHPSYRPGGWIPTVTHALNSGWLIHRHANKNDPAGWIDGCKNVRKDDRFSGASSWCDKVITSTAASGVSELDQQREWHATRMNGHIERHHTRARRAIA